jgi:predicted ATP-grasp superfamily ATP-dependent carboligase
MSTNHREVAIPATDTPVVVLGMFNHVGVGLLRSLGRCGVPMYAVHPDSRVPSALSRYCRRTFPWDVGRSSHDESLAFLRQVTEQLQARPILIPTEDVSAMFVEDNAEVLRGHFILPGQPAGLARALSSKREMHAMCKRHQVPTPETHFPKSREEVESFTSTATFPVVLKLVETPVFDADDLLRVGAGKAITQNANELLQVYDRIQDGAYGDVLLQEYIPGGPESVWMFNGYFDANSDCLISFTGRKLRQYPPDTGQTSLGLCIWNETVGRMTKAFLKNIGYRGIVDLGYRYDERDGQYKMLDINPRLGAAFRLFVATNGLDVARALYLDLTGQPVPLATPREGRKWLVENYDLVSCAQLWRQRRLTARRWSRSMRDLEETAWFATDDLAPFGMMWLSSFRIGLSRFRNRR